MDRNEKVYKVLQILLKYILTIMVESKTGETDAQIAFANEIVDLFDERNRSNSEIVTSIYSHPIKKGDRIYLKSANEDGYVTDGPSGTYGTIEIQLYSALNGSGAKRRITPHYVHSRGTQNGKPYWHIDDTHIIKR